MTTFCRRLAAYRSSFAALLIALACAAPASAQSSVNSPNTSSSSTTGPRSLEAPEINPTFATGMIVLLIGGVLILTSRGRSRSVIGTELQSTNR